ncbi:hypothetical protein N8977_00150 [Alphaproteobacteria bacterium]|jgi:hypothetical protein|nr:hypothetical protein [Alphaproteobacteria bacterium]
MKNIPKFKRKTMGKKAKKVGLIDLMSPDDQNELGYMASRDHEDDIYNHGSGVADKNYPKNLKSYALERWKRKYR